MKLDSLEFKRAERSRPKGYNKKVWLAMYLRAIRSKAWAEKTVKTSTKWANEASSYSLRHLGECLYKQPWELAKDSYDYLEMRSHGTTFIGTLDPSAKRVWEKITGRKIGQAKTRRYDHTIHIISATKKNDKWTDYRLNKAR